MPRDSDGKVLSTKWGAELKQALLHGLRIVVLGDLEHLPSLLKQLKMLRPNLRPWLRTQETDVAETMARHNPGPAWSGTVAVSADATLDPEEDILIRRAFGDCETVKLVQQPGGRSAKVFCGYARLTDSRAGPLPLPFFVKLDKDGKIKRELRNYEECTTLFVPFNQRPNLDANRCARGIARGIIVGNFVEESIPLRQAIENGHAHHAINSLFARALRGWRNQAYHVKANTVHAPLAKSLEFCLPSRYRPWRQRVIANTAKAAKALGAGCKPAELEQLLLKLPAIDHRVALMHGDMHGDNARVYGGTEAILIDFTSVSHGPLVADPATLDVSLIMGATSLSDTDWNSFARRCYSLENLRSLPMPAEPTDVSATLSNSIRQIRQIAFADRMSETEYATAVAIYLLRHASYPADNSNGTSDRLRRQTAYLLAERLILDLSGEALIVTSAPNPASTDLTLRTERLA